MRIFRYNSPLMSVLNRVADMMILNILWLCCSLPVITAGAATTALYSCLLVKDDAPVVRRFFTAFKSDFGRSTVLLGIWLIGMLLIAVDVFFYIYLLRDMDIWFRVLPMIPAALILMTSSYLFPLQAKFENRLSALLKNAVLMTLVHLPTSILITVINLLPLFLLYFGTSLFIYLLAVWTLFGFALLATANAHLIDKVFRLHIPQEGELTDGEL